MNATQRFAISFSFEKYPDSLYDTAWEKIMLVPIRLQRYNRQCLTMFRNVFAMFRNVSQCLTM